MNSRFLLKYIYMGNEYVKMIKEKIEELSILMSNLNKKRLFIEDEYEEIWVYDLLH